MIRTRARCAFAIVFVALASGCDSASPDPANPDPPFVAGPLGAVRLGPNDVVRIESLASLTGAPGLGAAAVGGAVLAAEDIGSIRERRVEAGDGIDSMCSPEGGAAAGTQVSAETDVAGLIGTTCSAAAAAASPIVSRAGMAMISPSNTSPLLTSDLNGNAGEHYHPGYFRVANNDLHQAVAVSRFAYDSLGLRTVAAVHDGDAYTTALTSAFRSEFEELGGVVSATIEIRKNQTDFADELAEIADGEPDGVFFPLFVREGSPFAAQAAAFDGFAEDVAFISGAALLVSEFLALPQSADIFFAATEASFGSRTNSLTGQNGMDVLARFTASRGSPPSSPYWAHAYDAFSMMAAAIDSAGVEQGDTLYIDRAALREQLARTSFQGLIGEISCGEFGDCGTGRVNVYHHNDPTVTDPSMIEIVYRYVP